MTRGSQWRVELSGSARRRGPERLPGAGGRVGVSLVFVTNHGLGLSAGIEATRSRPGPTGPDPDPRSPLKHALARHLAIKPHVTIYDPRSVRAGDVR